MTKKLFPIVRATLADIVGGGQTITTLDDGRKCFIWGGLPGETVDIQITKKKSRLSEGVVTSVISASDNRVEPHDPGSYLSTSPWQIMNFDAEQHYKAALIEEAFELHDIVLPNPIEIFSDEHQYGYRNKIEFSWYGQTDEDGDHLDLAFFRRGSKGKIVIEQMSLARPEIVTLALQIRDLLRAKPLTARNLKTLLIRCNQEGQCVWQLYIKDKLDDVITADEAANLSAIGGEIIYSDPRSPASRITERLAKFGDIVLEDTILGVPFRYATEGFFQVNLPVYEHALHDMKGWVVQGSDKRVTMNGAAPVSNDGPGNGATVKTLDLYSGVGTIGLTIGGADCTLVEIDENAVREMRRNIKELGSSAEAVLAPSEKALDYIRSNEIIIVDPPRAGLHADVVTQLLTVGPPRIIYLSCNPVTQARDVQLLCADGVYGIAHHQGYNFFPRTPHIEHLVVLELKSK